MIILKDRSSYLERRTTLNLIGLIASLFLNIPLFFLISLYSLVLTLPLVYKFYYAYSNYKRGLKGEEAVIEALSCLSDDYYLINDVKLPNLRGNIDHILLGPNGIFVIETKNYSGTIECDGDSWKRIVGEKEYEIPSPSKQVKRNAMALKRALEYVLERKISQVEEVVVFTNPDVIILFSNPTVTVLSVEKLCDYVKSRELVVFSREELDQIAQVILKLSED